MDMRKIELITCPEGDWEVLKVDGDIWTEGHEVTEWGWMGLIKDLTGIKVVEREISDEDMEEGNY